MMKKFKFGLVGILVGLFGIINFSNGFNLTLNSDSNLDILNSNGVYGIYPLNGTILISNNQVTGIIEFGVDGYKYLRNGSIWGAGINAVPRLLQGSYEVICKDSPCYVKFDGLNAINVLDISCPEVNTGEILSGSCDTNYCISNDLCPISSGVSWSELVINDILHESAPLINITIPEEYNWDSTVDENEFTLVISGQNVDYEYVDGIIRTQKFTPDSDDFNSIVTGLVPLLIPGLVIILFIWFIFRFIKKIF